jgi:hypothetical protein
LSARTTDELHAIAARLAIRPADNTDEDWKHLEAACLLLGELAPSRTRAMLKVHKSLSGE